MLSERKEWPISLVIPIIQLLSQVPTYKSFTLYTVRAGV